jgi:putative tryptophan/tyrosine transport system substrate-binding protein
MKRREFVALLGGSVVAWPATGRAQQPGVPIVGFLSAATRDEFEPYEAAFREGLKEAGFVEGRNLSIEYRYADDHYDRLSALATDLVENAVAVIAADPRGVYAVQKVTKTVPVVFMSGADPVRNGLVTSLNRPGGNLTGVTILANDLNAKRFGLFRDMVPQASNIGVLSDSTNPRGGFALQEVQAAAQRLAVPVRVLAAGTVSELDSAFATFADERVGAVFVINGFFLFGQSNRLIELASRYRFPLSGEERKYAEGGALMSYGPSLANAFHEVGVYTARILKGEKPADLPVEQPAKFEFVINLKTAKAFGLIIPQSIILLADEVIE